MYSYCILTEAKAVAADEIGRGGRGFAELYALRDAHAVNHKSLQKGEYFRNKPKGIVLPPFPPPGGSGAKVAAGLNK